MRLRQSRNTVLMSLILLLAMTWVITHGLDGLLY